MLFHVKIGITGKQRGNQYAEIEGQLVTSKTNLLFVLV